MRPAATVLVTVAGGLLATTAIAALMLAGFKWMDDNDALGFGSGWAGLILLARALLVPVMLFVAVRAGCNAIKILQKRSEVFPPTATTAIIYFGVTVVYVFVGMAIPGIGPLYFESAIYWLPALLLLVATVLAISKDGQLPGPPVVSPHRATVIAALAWTLTVGASVAYARHVLAGDVMDCFIWECPPSRTVSVSALIVASATVTATMVAWGALRPKRMTRGVTIAVTAFGCLALLFPMTIQLLVMPYDAFVPGFFYGLTAIALLVAGVARQDAEPFPLPAR